MREEVRFSVVCAAYNAAGTVLRAVESCLDQTVPPYEVIVVDDGSTDETTAILEQAFGARVRIIRSEKNGGPSEARNRGMDTATGDFIVLQDADDVWHPEKLARVKAALVAAPGVRFLFHRYTLQPALLPPDPCLLHFPLWKLLLRNVVATPCAVFVNDGKMRFDEALRQMEDWDFFLRLAERYGAWLLDAPLTVLGRPVLSPGGLSSSRRRMRMGEMRVYRKWAASRPLYWPLLPVALLWSAAKAARKALRIK